MTDPQLTESAWERAKAEAEAAYKSTPFAISMALLATLAAGLGVALTSGQDDAAIQIVVPILTGVAAIAVSLLAVLAFHVYRAPFRQRDEARGRLGATASPSPHAIDLGLRDLRRKGDDLLKALLAGSLEGAGGKSAVETWTEETVAYMSEHCDPAITAQFIEASRGTPSFIPSVKKRLLALDKGIAASAA